jgi:ankyrin repeat protein
MSKSALFKAAQSWDAGTVEQLLAQSPELLSACDARGRTALHICSGASAVAHAARVPASLATARALLRAGADINAVHEIPDGREVFPATPLWYALARGRNGQLARLLLRAGADPNNCLWTVIWSKEPDLLRLLLRAGARPNDRFDGETPLIYAARLAREDAVLQLVDAGADVTARDTKGRTAIEHARSKRLSTAVLAALGEPGSRERTRRGGA